MSNNQNNINQGQNNFQENIEVTKKKPFYKKVWFIILAVIVAIIVLGGIFSSGDSSTDSDNNSASQSENKADKIQKNEAKLGDYEVVIEKCEHVKDYDGNDVAVVTFVFTNNSSQGATFDYVLQAKAFQDGVEAERNYAYDVLSDKYDEDGNQYKEIKPGNSINVRIAYTLNSIEKPLEVEVSELFSFDSTVIKKTFNF